MWDVTTPDRPGLLATLDDKVPRFLSPASHVAFSADGQYLAKTAVDGTVRLWNVSNADNPAAVATLTSDVNSVQVLALTPDSHTLVTANNNGTVDLRTTDPDEAIRLICSVTGSRITDAEWDRYAPDIPRDQPCPP